MDANKEIRWSKEWEVSEMKNDPHYKLISIIVGRKILVKFIAVLLNIFSQAFAHTYFNDNKVLLLNMFIIIKFFDDRNF